MDIYAKLGLQPDGRLSKLPGRCALCEHEAPELVQDHNHETGAKRDQVCRGCNLQIGLVENGRLRSVSLATRALVSDYLVRWSN